MSDHIFYLFNCRRASYLFYVFGPIYVHRFSCPYQGSGTADHDTLPMLTICPAVCLYKLEQAVFSELVNSNRWLCFSRALWTQIKFALNPEYWHKNERERHERSFFEVAVNLERENVITWCLSSKGLAAITPNLWAVNQSCSKDSIIFDLATVVWKKKKKFSLGRESGARVPCWASADVPTPCSMQEFLWSHW